MTWSMLLALSGLLSFIASNILSTMADKTKGLPAAQRQMGTSLVFFALAIAYGKGWL